MLTPDQRHALLLADRSRNSDVIRGAIERVQENNPSATLLDCEMAFRDAAAQTYLVIDAEGVLHIAMGMQAWRELTILAGEGRGTAEHWEATVKANHARLAAH